MGFVEGVAGERLDEIEDGARLGVAVAVFDGSGDELLAFRLHEGGDLLRHGFADGVCVLQFVAGELLHDEQHLVLKDDDAVGLVQDLREIRVRVLDQRAVVLGAAVRADVLHGARPVERDERDEFGDAGRAQLLDGAPHARRLELEDAERVAAAEHVERLRVAIGERREVDGDAVCALDVLDGAPEDGEVGEAEEVHLQQADFGDLRHGELRRRDR